MKINANFHAINKYCMKKNLTPNSDLSYWLQFGFPKEMKMIEIDDYASVIIKVKPEKKVNNNPNHLTLNTKLKFGKYKNYTFEKVIQMNNGYAKWLINVWEGIVTDEVRNAADGKRKKTLKELLGLQ